MKNHKKIFFIIRDILTPGGAQLSTLRLARVLLSRGCNISFIGQGDSNTIKKHLRMHGIKAPVVIYTVHEPVKLFSPIARLFPNIYFWLLCSILLFKIRKKFDVLYSPLLMENIVHCGFAEIFLKKPSIIKIGSAGEYGDAKRASQSKLNGLIRILAKRITLFVCLTKEIKNELNTTLNIPTTRLKQITNGIDTKTFFPINAPEKCVIRSQIGIPQNKKIVLFAGRLERKKRVGFLLNAWEEVQKLRHGIDILLVVGDGSLRPELKKLSSKMAFNKTVIFFGHSNLVSTIMQSADIFVLPSLSEGMANVLLESMATGLPIVATGTDGNKEILEHNENSLLFEKDSIKGLVESLYFLLEHEDTALKLGNNGRKFVEEYFSIDKVATQYTALFEMQTKSESIL